MNITNAEILCVGTEILLGDIINTNSAYIARGLAECGVGCYFQTVVGDNPERLEKCLSIALDRADIVIMTGGLGPTYDDLTKETVAKHFGLDMELHKPSLDQLTKLFRRMGREMTDNNLQQAYMPAGSTVFHNDRGTANGLMVQKDGKTAILMPGPPREMTAMFDKYVKPFLSSLSGGALVSSVVHFYGIGESALEQRMRDYMKTHGNPTVAPYAKEGEVQLRVTAKADNEKAARALIAPVVEEIKAIFPDNVYGVDVGNLQNALVLKLLEKSKTIATAESCTAGLVSKRITEISGSSKVFGCGVAAYSNEIKSRVLGVAEDTLNNFGAVSRETAAEMAEGVRRLSGADIGLSVTGIAGPGGGTKEKPVGLVYVAVTSDNYSDCRELSLSRGYGGEREHIRYLASSNALHLALTAAIKA